MRLIRFEWVLLLIIVFTSCKKDEENIIVDENNITIGFLIPETGAGASTGESINAAIGFAIEDINKYLEEIGSDKTISIFTEDSGTDPVQALEKLKLLKGKRIRFVIGPYSSASLTAIKQYADENGILIVSPSSVAPSLAIAGDNIFRLVPNDISQGEAMTAMLKDDSIEAIVPIIRDDLWGNELLEATEQKFSDVYGYTFFPVKYSTSSTDFSSIIDQLNTNLNNALNQFPANKLGIYLVSFGEGTDILSEASLIPLLGQVKWYGSSAFADNSYLLLDINASAFASDRKFACPIFGYDKNAEDKYGPLIQKIETEIGRKPEIYGLVAYDALWLGVLSYLSTGTNTTSDKLKKAFVHEADIFFGVTGRTTLNEAGDRAYATYEFWGIKYFLNDFSWEVVAKYNNATGELQRY